MHAAVPADLYAIPALLYSKCSTRYVVRVTNKTRHTESLTWSLTHNNTHYVYAGEILIWVPCERPPRSGWRKR